MKNFGQGFMLVCLIILVGLALSAAPSKVQAGNCDDCNRWWEEGLAWNVSWCEDSSSCEISVGNPKVKEETVYLTAEAEIEIDCAPEGETAKIGGTYTHSLSTDWAITSQVGFELGSEAVGKITGSVSSSAGGSEKVDATVTLEKTRTFTCEEGTWSCDVNFYKRDAEVDITADLEVKGEYCTPACWTVWAQYCAGVSTYSQNCKTGPVTLSRAAKIALENCNVDVSSCCLKIDSTNPDDGAHNVSDDTRMEIEFSRAMDRDSVEKAITIAPYTDYSTVWNAELTVITIIPSDTLLANTKYTATVGTTAMCQKGVHLREPYTFSFTTAKDAIAPVLKIASPLPHETVSDIVKIEVEVEDNVDPAPLAEFIVNGVSIGYDETPPYEYTWDASHQEIGSEHTITVKVTDKSGNTTEAVVAVKIGPEEPTAVTASGQHLQAVFAPADIDSVKLAVEKTPAPYKPELWESHASVSDWTEGFLTLSYTDVNGEGIWVEQGIHINNTTKEILGEMIDVRVDTITVGAIFGPLPSISGEEDMTLTLDFSYPISITMGPVFQLQLQAGVNKYVTDKGREVEVFDDGRPNDPDLTEAEADAVLDALGLKDKVEKKAGPSDAYDCHGWTFTCGKKWINNDQVQKILDDNGYSKTTKPKVGDIAVYKDSNGNITHTGVVREVDENGNVVDVESKWGALGRYDHKPGDVPPDYGTPEYHHTDRQGEGEGKDRHTIKTE